MTRLAVAETLRPMTMKDVPLSRGQIIEQRMRDKGWTPSDLAAEAGKSRSLVYRVIRDEPKLRPESYRAFELALDRLDHEDGVGGSDAVLSTDEGLIKFEVTGDFGVRVVVTGPIMNAEELEASVARLIRDIRRPPPGGNLGQSVSAIP